MRKDGVEVLSGPIRHRPEFPDEAQRRTGQMFPDRNEEAREDRTEGVRIEHSARDKRWYVQWGGSGTGEPPRTKGFPTESAAKRFAAQVRRDIRMERTGYR